MIVAPAPLPADGPGGRLLRALARRGHAVGEPAAAAGAVTLLLCPAADEPAPDLRGWLAARAPAADLRLLVVTRLGTHPDAIGARLRECWALEEAARGSGLPLLVLRLGPMLGPVSPLWRKLRLAPRLPRRGAKLVNPVAEADVVETLDRALSGAAEWKGWYEVAGPEVWSLAELVGLARRSGPEPAARAGAWEPPMAEIEEHRLAEAGPWLGHFRMAPRPLAEQAREWETAPVAGAS